MHTSLLPLSLDNKGLARRHTRPARARALAACLIAAALTAAAAVTTPAGRAAAANTLTVTNTNDSGAGSLRQAIADAASGDTINFSLPSGSTITLTSVELLINKSLNITGPGASSLAVGSQRQFRVLRVTSGVTVKVSGLTIRDGFTSPVTDPVNGGGGAVYNAGTLTLAGCVVANSTAVGGVVISSGLAFSGGGIANSGTLTLTNTTVSGNTVSGSVSVPDFRADGNGGGIYNSPGGTLTLTDSTVTRNLATGGSAGSSGVEGSASGGGIYNAGALAMTNSTVSSNSVAGTGSSGSSTSGASSGGGVDNSGTLTVNGCSIVNNAALSAFAFSGSPASGLGGGVNNRASGTLTMTNCTVSGNGAAGGSVNADATPATGLGGGINNLSNATLTNTTVSGNFARGSAVANNNTSGAATGGGAEGGGVNSVGSLTLTNSTVSGNEAQGGFTRDNNPGAGGKASGGGILAEGTLTLTNSTVTLNAAAGGRGLTSSAEGGGILFRGSGTAKPLNTIVAGNSVRGNSNAGGANDTTAAPDVSGTFASQGHNLVGRNDGAQASFPAGTPNASGDLVGTSALPVNAKLGPLANNGGPTRTHRPWPGSPAVEGGDNAVLSPPYNLATDQRGAGFPRLFNSKVDIGSVEARDSAVTFDLSVVSGVVEGINSFDIGVKRTGALDAGDLTVDISVTDGTASSRSDFKQSFATLRFASGETEKSFIIFITDDGYAEPNETVSVRLSNPTGGAALGANATTTFFINDTERTDLPTNPLDATQYFVRQHYVDFLGREPDAPGLAFWTNQIESCGADAQCREVKRIHVSAAFFLSIEFKETGFFALRVRRAAFGKRSASAASRVTLAEFLHDSWQLGEGVVVGPTDWQRRLEQNKQDYVAGLVETAAFRTSYPDTLTAAGYVDALFLSAGVTPTAVERSAALSAYGWGGTAGRAAALRSVAESAAVTNAEVNPAFVLSEYFGYLQRNPTDAPDSDDSGYQFWLAKLNQFDGDFIKAEMVKAFISSAEYRRRFGHN